MTISEEIDAVAKELDLTDWSKEGK